MNLKRKEGQTMAEITEPYQKPDNQWYFDFGNITYGPFIFLTTAFMTQESLKMQQATLGVKQARERRV